MKIGTDPLRCDPGNIWLTKGCIALWAAAMWRSATQQAGQGALGCAGNDLSVHSAKSSHPVVMHQALKEPAVSEMLVPEFKKPKKWVFDGFGEEDEVIGYKPLSVCVFCVLFCF